MIRTVRKMVNNLEPAMMDSSNSLHIDLWYDLSVLVEEHPRCQLCSGIFLSYFFTWKPHTFSISESQAHFLVQLHKITVNLISINLFRFHRHQTEERLFRSFNTLTESRLHKIKRSILDLRS